MAVTTLCDLVATEPRPESIQEAYLDLVKRTLTRVLVARRSERQTIRASVLPKRLVVGAIQSVLGLLSLELVKRIECGADDYLESGDAAINRAEDAETMLGVRQLDSMQRCIRDVLERGVPGDLLEAGVWRGGMTIFMKAVLAAYADDVRRVWVVDSFAGLPESDRAVETFGWRAGAMSASLEEVQANFRRYGLLDDRVRFVKGYFEDSLPKSEIGRLAILRIDADLYQSTMTALTHLYPKLSVGGYAVFDDYQNLPDCRRAIDEYRAANGIVDPIVRIDTRAVLWKRSK